MIKRTLTVLLITISVFSINAQENDPTHSIFDTCSIFLNINERLNTIYSEIEIVTEKELDHLFSLNFLNFKLKEGVKVSDSGLEQMSGFPRIGGVTIEPNPLIHKN